MAGIKISGTTYNNGSGTIREVNYNGQAATEVRVDGTTVWNKPVDGVFSGWSGWSACTVDCGGGTQDRTRDCSSPAPTYGGYDCSGSTSESQTCNTQSCAVYYAASGGSVSTSGDYKIHTFTGSGTFNISTAGNTGVEILCLAGGGSGGGSAWAIQGGGGGAGGYISKSYSDSGDFSTGGYVINIGAGGQSSTGCHSCGTNGSNTTGMGLTAIGGGESASWTGAGATAGGSGGGAYGQTNGGTGGAGTAGQGKPGGNCLVYAAPYNGAGGGGAGSNGFNGGNGNAGYGGYGRSHIDGTTRAAGGSGGCTAARYGSGSSNLGGGGLGGCNTINVGGGDSGIFQVRYKFQ